MPNSESISIYCSSCKKKIKTAASNAGKSGKCPRCKTAFTIPNVSAIELPIVLPPNPGVNGANIDDDLVAISPNNATVELAKILSSNDESAERLKQIREQRVAVEADDAKFGKGLKVAGMIALAVILVVAVFWYSPIFGAGGALVGVTLWLILRYDPHSSSEIQIYSPESGDLSLPVKMPWKTDNEDQKTITVQIPLPKLTIEDSKVHIPKSSSTDNANQRATKNCPFCGEKILQVALVCKHCQRDLDKTVLAPEFAQLGVSPNQSVSTQVKTFTYKQGILGGYRRLGVSGALEMNKHISEMLSDGWEVVSTTANPGSYLSKPSTIIVTFKSKRTQSAQNSVQGVGNIVAGFVGLTVIVIVCCGLPFLFFGGGKVEDSDTSVPRSTSDSQSQPSNAHSQQSFRCGKCGKSVSLWDGHLGSRPEDNRCAACLKPYKDLQEEYERQQYLKGLKK